MSTSPAPFPTSSPDESELLAILGDATERVYAEEDAQRLWHRVVDEAAALFRTTAAIVRWCGGEWQVLACSATAGPVLVRGVLVSHLHSRFGSGRRAPVSAGTGAPPPVFDARWRSVFAVDLDCSPNRQPTRLAWLSSTAEAFDCWTVTAATFFGRHVGHAVRNVTARRTLSAAVEAHRRVGSVHETLSARYGLTAGEVFTLLDQQSQEADGELRTIAARMQAADSGDTTPGAVTGPSHTPAYSSFGSPS